MRSLTLLVLVSAFASSAGYGARWLNEPKPPAEGLELKDVFLTDGECGRSGRVIILRTERADGLTYDLKEAATPRSQRLNVRGTFRGEKILMVVEFDR